MNPKPNRFWTIRWDALELAGEKALSVPALMHKTGISQRQAQRWICQLRDDGAIIEAGTQKTGRRGPAIKLWAGISYRGYLTRRVEIAHVDRPKLKVLRESGQMNPNARLRVENYRPGSASAPSRFGADSADFEVFLSFTADVRDPMAEFWRLLAEEPAPVNEDNQ